MIETKSKHSKTLLRFTTIGSVDNGKSTLIGRLLLDSKAIFKNQLDDIKTDIETDDVNLAFLTDGLKREREEGITIDVAYRYFTTPARKFIIADSPGHFEFTRNMVTGSSTANAALVLVDAVNGINEQIKRHTIISSLLGIPHLVVCINKMDSIGFSENIYLEIREEFKEFAAKLIFTDIQFIPISALKGDNVVNRSASMDWYSGPTLIYILENLYTTGDRDLINCRFPVQMIIENNNVVYITGNIAGGIFKIGDKIKVLPNGNESIIKEIKSGDRGLHEAYPPLSVSMILQNNFEIKRGDMIVRAGNTPQIGSNIDAMMCWFDDKNTMNHEKTYLIKHTTKEVNCKIIEIIYRININTLHRDFEFENISANDIVRVILKTDENLFFDPYSKNRITGSFILVDLESNNTVAAGMIRG